MPRNSQFTFENLSTGFVPNAEGKQVFAMVQWRSKEPFAYLGVVFNDVYLWTSLVRQYFIFMQGSAQQEVAFTATLL